MGFDVEVAPGNKHVQPFFPAGASYNDHAPNNSGVFLYLEIMTPVLILFLTLYHRRKSVTTPR